MSTKHWVKNPRRAAPIVATPILALLCLGLIVAITVQISSKSPQISPMARVSTGAKLNWNWFSNDQSSLSVNEVTQAIPDQLSTAKINAQLLGVVMAGESSSATLKVNSAPEAVYKRGDDLGSNSIIVDIQPYRIVVNQDGVNKQILLKKPESIIQTELVPSGNQTGPEEGFALANMFGAVPVVTSGGAGFKLNNLSDEMKQLADIQENDIITHIDGVEIQTIMANPQQWITLSGSSNLAVTVEREGQEETLYVNAASLSAKMLPNLGFSP